jgi:Thymidylate synthase
MSRIIVADSLANAWEKSLAVFSDDHGLNRFDSTRGPCVEFENIVIHATDAAAVPQVSPVYQRQFLPLIDSYADGFLGKPSARSSTVSQRLYSWGAAAEQRHLSGPLDQVERAEHFLVDHPESRYNVLSLWDPSVDPDLRNPVSPLVAYLRLRSGRLRSTLVARTVDAWLGAFPMFVGFARLNERLAIKTGSKVGSISFFVFSYHVYEMDLPLLRSMAVSDHD